MVNITWSSILHTIQVGGNEPVISGQYVHNINLGLHFDHDQ